ncbi:MAG: hypothetical protein CFH22_01350 [Alphaproteobacteria bacterium MarineAlpha5_Bin12]|nr:hypothetical protein [Pelagibacteraceae bacterium]PPR40691.1 MAG: hypothetical protein CFH22_01350 [Alphaproteobacteria bacterium MarineAlpha5_Bin12]|tara:strand:- start:12771 stop:13157 length:387 start_codon:yes stop_codon:yes gene_type:complete
MIISAPISLGELIDKISILLIKRKKITDESKNNHISNELNKLQEILNNSSIDKKKIDPLIIELKNINLKLWQIEDEIRICEKEKDFSEKFVNLARSVYKYNDIRASIKLKINNDFGSSLVEIKSYENY